MKLTDIRYRTIRLNRRGRNRDALRTNIAHQLPNHISQAARIRT